MFEEPPFHPYAPFVHLPTELFEVQGDFWLRTEGDLCFEFIQFDVETVHGIYPYPRLPSRRTGSAQIKFNRQLEVQDFACPFHQQVDFTCRSFAQLHHVVSGFYGPFWVVAEPHRNACFESVA